MIKGQRNQTFSIIVSPVNDIPEVSDRTETLNLDNGETYIDIILEGTDVEDDNANLTFSIESDDNNDAISLIGNVVTYTHPSDSTEETYTFTYQAIDSEGAPSEIGTVTITIIGASD